MKIILSLQRNAPHLDETGSRENNKKESEDITPIPEKKEDETPHIPQSPQNKK
jgi:hypothetical protein